MRFLSSLGKYKGFPTFLPFIMLKNNVGNKQDSLYLIYLWKTLAATAMGRNMEMFHKFRPLELVEWAFNKR